MKKYKNGQIVTIKGKKYRIVHGFCHRCALWGERLKIMKAGGIGTWACRAYCEKEHLRYNQMFTQL